MEKNKSKCLHIIIIILGIIWVSIPVFHANLWFDESYSVGMANHTFSEIWNIGGHDVHPVLYYWILHIIQLLFGNQIILYRIFSAICVAILGILGYTHIRKDFGDKTGMFFSFLVFFFPINLVYAGELRMYTLAMLLVTLMAIYAYRIYKRKEEKNIKNWILFAIFSLASAYSHYYALVAAGIINLLLFISFVVDAKQKKQFTYSLKAFILSAVIQIACYLPWIMYLLLQVSQVSNGFWIGISFPGTIIEFFTFQFTGNLGDTTYVSNILAGIFGIIICVYMIYLYVKRKKENKENSDENKKKESNLALLAISVYGLVILAVCLASLIIWRPVIYARYMLCVTGLFLFFLADTMAKMGNQKWNMLISTLCIAISIVIMINLVQNNYDASNQEPLNYIKENIQEGDVILNGNEGSGFVIGANYPEHTHYFWDQANWNVEEAYRAFGTDMHTVYNLDDFKNFTGRVWIINANNYAICDYVLENFENAELLEKKEFKTKYKNFEYTFALVNFRDVP